MTQLALWLAKKLLGTITTNSRDHHMQLQKSRWLWLLYSRHDTKFWRNTVKIVSPMLLSNTLY